MQHWIPLLIFFAVNYAVPAQSIIHGTVKNEDDNPLSGVNVQITETGQGTTTISDGMYSFEHRTGTWTLRFSHVGYQPLVREVTVTDDSLEINIILQVSDHILGDVEIVSQQEREHAGLYRISPRSAKVLASPFVDISRILATLPGVVSNNELSSSYSVRGGNFDENLVYIDDIPVYRPQLVKAGRQEGLNFVNTDLARSVNFYAGGWGPEYGDKLSSSLNVSYKDPRKFAGSAKLSLLMATAHIQGSSKDGKFNFMAGVRHRNLKYLLNTFEVEGQYLPRYTDIQSVLRWKLSPKTRLSFLNLYARNSYLVEPLSQETDFGAFGGGSFRLFVAFEGNEQLRYDIYQGAVKLTHDFSKSFKTDIITSYVKSLERDYADLEGGYRLCDIDNDPFSSSYNQCTAVRGVGTNYHYSRNRLDTRLAFLQIRNTFYLDPSNTFKFGIEYENQHFSDNIDEYEFIDSARFVTITDRIRTHNMLTANQAKGYFQHKLLLSPFSSLTYGFRLQFRDINKQFLFSPRILYTLIPDWEKNVSFKAAIGYYHQPPFYKDMRGFDGGLLTDQLAQSSLHIIAGADYSFSMWDRPFILTSEAYYKYMPRTIPYDVENIRIRYHAGRSARAFAYGLDTRLSGEFIKGTESWFSLGLLNTKEDIENTDPGYVNRPTNQHLKFSIFFQDHIPNNPSLRVSLSMLYGSGLPFGPPQSLANRNSFRGREYRRADIGFSKIFAFNDTNRLDELAIGLDILNLFGAENEISYTWISDLNGARFAVPNRLSQRFFNLWIKASI